MSWRLLGARKGNEVSSKVVISNLQRDYSKLKQKLLTSIITQKDIFIRKLESWASKMLKLCDQLTYHDLLTQTGASIAKKHYEISYIEEHNKLLFSPLLDTYTERQLISRLEGFNTRLGTAFKNCIKEIESIHFSPLEMEVEDWDHHKSFKIRPVDKYLLFDRKEGYMNDWNCALYNVPLDIQSKFKVNILSIYHKDRAMSIAVCDGAGFKKLKESYSGRTFGHTVYYNGYYHQNLIGDLPTTNHTSKSGFDSSKEYFVEFLQDKEVRFYNEEGTLDMRGSFKGKNGPFYLFLGFHYPNTSCTVERLW